MYKWTSTRPRWQHCQWLEVILKNEHFGQQRISRPTKRHGARSKGKPYWKHQVVHQAVAESGKMTLSEFAPHSSLTSNYSLLKESSQETWKMKQSETAQHLPAVFFVPLKLCLGDGRGFTLQHSSLSHRSARGPGFRDEGGVCETNSHLVVKWTFLSQTMSIFYHTLRKFEHTKCFASTWIISINNKNSSKAKSILW